MSRTSQANKKEVERLLLTGVTQAVEAKGNTVTPMNNSLAVELRHKQHWPSVPYPVLFKHGSVVDAACTGHLMHFCLTGLSLEKQPARVSIGAGPEVSANGPRQVVRV